MTDLQNKGGKQECHIFLFKNKCGHQQNLKKKKYTLKPNHFHSFFPQPRFQLQSFPWLQPPCNTDIPSAVRAGPTSTQNTRAKNHLYSSSTPHICGFKLKFMLSFLFRMHYYVQYFLSFCFQATKSQPHHSQKNTWISLKGIWFFHSIFFSQNI